MKIEMNEEAAFAVLVVSVCVFFAIAAWASTLRNQCKCQQKPNVVIQQDSTGVHAVQWPTNRMEEP